VKPINRYAILIPLFSAIISSTFAQRVIADSNFADYLFRLNLFEDAGYEYLTDLSQSENLLQSARSFRAANDLNNYFKIIKLIIDDSKDYDSIKNAIIDLEKFAFYSGDTAILAFIYDTHPEIDSTIIFLRQEKWSKIGFIKPKKKNEVLAETMSMLIPGSGQIYVGNYGEGIRSLALNSLLWFIVISGFSNGYYPRAIVVYYFFTNRYWIGGAIRARECAQNFNKKKLAETLRDAIEKAESHCD